MNVRSAILFPDTVPSERMLIPLVQVFDQLVYFQTVENDVVPDELHSVVCEEMERRSLCRAEVPAPLGGERERFLRMVSDLRNRREDYAARLGHVALAGISSASRREAESRTSILSRLLSGETATPADQDEAARLLWQARLVLKLGELYDAEQGELLGELRRIRAKEEQLLRELRSGEDTPFKTAVLPEAAGAGREKMQKLRCAAWAKLFALGAGRSDAGRIFLAGDRDGVDMLLERYESRAGHRAAHLLDCLLPAGHPQGEELFFKISRFRSDSAALRGKLAAVLDNPETARQPDLDLWSAAEEEAWTKLLADYYPPGTCGRTRLSLFACPGISPAHLFFDAFADGGEKLFTEPLPAGSGCVVGVLEGA
jgi:hypothetical protein